MSNKNKYRLTDFFNAHWDKYVKQPSKFILPEQYKAVNAMRECRTAALGVNYCVCTKCGKFQNELHKNQYVAKNMSTK